MPGIQTELPGARYADFLTVHTHCPLGTRCVLYMCSSMHCRNWTRVKLDFLWTQILACRSHTLLWKLETLQWVRQEQKTFLKDWTLSLAAFLPQFFLLPVKFQVLHFNRCTPIIRNKPKNWRHLIAAWYWTGWSDPARHPVSIISGTSNTILNYTKRGKQCD